MICEIFHEEKELKCRRAIMQSLEHVLKRGDEVFERLTAKECKSPNIVSYAKFKEHLKDVNHENLK